MRLIANLSLMFTEVPLERRFAEAARAGFDGVEIQFPYEIDADALCRAAGDLPVELINVPAAHPSGGIGLATDARLEGDFRDAVEIAARYAGALGVRKLNVLAGAPPDGQAPGLTEDTLAENVRHASRRFRALGIDTVVEAINPVDMPGFWLDGLEKSLGFLDTLGDPSVKLQFDLYHMALTEPDLPAAIERAGWRIGHVQFADAPGRHEPGTGGIDFAAAFAALARTGYRGAVSAEYRPAGRTADGLGWMAALRGRLG